MMTKTEEKIEFAQILTREFPNQPLVYVRAFVNKVCRLGATSKRYAELECNRGLNSIEEKRNLRNDEKIKQLALEFGCKDVVLGGDPRGATVKLVLPSGYANDWGREGVCVPTS